MSRAEGQGGAGARPPRFVVPAEDLARELVAGTRFGPHVEAVHEIPARAARYGAWPAALDPAVRRAAAARGIERLYLHQSRAVEAALAAGGSGEDYAIGGRTGTGGTGTGRRGTEGPSAERPGTDPTDSGRTSSPVALAVATGTASGKSLCYTLPLLHECLRDEGARALLLFPTKALARDQLAALRAWDAALDAPVLRPAAYDGDTPSGQRQRARREARLLLSNPDMLHAGILPHHTRWADFLAGLRWIVLDEMHVYRGIFGSHVANVLRRLRRVAAFHGAQPRYLLTSATIANPAELGRRLTGRQTTVIDEDGAPRGIRHFVFYNPPVIDPVLNLRRSAILEADRIARHFLDGGVQTIVFARTRQTAELLTRYIAQGLGDARAQPAWDDGAGDLDRFDGESGIQGGLAPGDPRSTAGWGDASPDALAGDVPIRGYRGGYTATERRAIEAALREGRLRGVVATNALELGIDIGELDACVMTGYPGTVASAWQQAGRAGRRGADAVAVLVATAAPLDQYIMRHPSWILGRAPEAARLDPDNLLILLDHLRCAAYELPFDAAEAAMPFGAAQIPLPPPLDPGASDAHGDDHTGRDDQDEKPTGPIRPSAPIASDLLAVLEAQGDLRLVEGRWYWLAEGYPAERVSLRTAGAEQVSIVRGRPPSDATVVSDNASTTDNTTSTSAAAPPRAADVLGTVDRGRAPSVVHEGAIYLHDGVTWRVETLDWEAGRAYVAPADGATYTRASGSTAVTPVDVRARRDAPGAEIAHGELEVRSRVTGYRVLRFKTHETLGWGRVDLPEQVHVAAGYWCCLSEEAVEHLRAIGQWDHEPVFDRGPEWPEVRRRALERDGGTCAHCGAPPPPSRSHDVHHIKPWRRFGTGEAARQRANAPDNLITLCKACHAQAERALGLHGSLSSIGYALSHVAPLYLMCDPGDLGVSAVAHAPWSGRPTIVIYERAAAGVGFGEALYERHEGLIKAARELIKDCPCAHGCPSCVGAADSASEEAKAHALAVLDALS